MINEQVKELREKANLFSMLFTGDGVVRILNQAADTIEALSAKLAAANMERSERYYNSAWIPWIPCSDRLPEENGHYVVTFREGLKCDVRHYDFVDGHWMNGIVNLDKYIVAWSQLKPYNPDITVSAQRHYGGRWVLRNERMPGKGGVYLATLCGDDLFSGMAEFENGRWVDTAEFEDGKWVDEDEDYKCVLAWMPLPEPYKPNREVKE